MTTVSITDPKTKFKVEYFMQDRVYQGITKKIIPSINKKNKDCFFIVDGYEGAGKSTFAFQLGKLVDPTLNLDRVVFSPDDFREAVLKAKKAQCVVYDEAFTGFSSRSSLSPINKVLVSLAMQMRQKNLFIIIVLPTIFMLDRYIAIMRAKALFHVYENKGVRGYYRVFNRKKKRMLVLLGKKTMSYTHKEARTGFKGRFYGKFALGDEEVEKAYLIKKETALQDSEKTSMSSAQVRYKEQRDLLIYLLRKYSHLTYKELAVLLLDYEMDMSFVQLSRICTKFGDNLKDIEEKEEKIEESEGVEPEFDDEEEILEESEGV